MGDAVASEDLTTLLLQAIRERILSPGEVLVQEEIAKRLGVSRIPLREALRGLAATGVVEMQPGRGFRVTKLDAAEIAELYALRLRIEPSLADAVVANATPAVIGELARLDSEMRAAPEPEPWSSLNYSFHLRMYEATGMTHTCRIVRQLLDLVEPYSRLYVHELHNLDRVENEHTRMVEAVRQGDPTTLDELITVHLEGARDGLVQVMAGSAEADRVTSLAGLSDRKRSTSRTGRSARRSARTGTNWRRGQP